MLHYQAWATSSCAAALVKVVDGHTSGNACFLANRACLSRGALLITISLVVPLNLYCKLSAHHHKWLAMDGIHGASSKQPDFLDAADNFLLTVLARCQGSNWWSMFAWFTLISFFIWVCLSVDINLTSMSLATMFAKLSTNPFFSIWLELATWDTDTTLKSMTFWLVTSKNV